MYSQGNDGRPGGLGVKGEMGQLGDIGPNGNNQSDTLLTNSILSECNLCYYTVGQSCNLHLGKAIDNVTVAIQHLTVVSDRNTCTTVNDMLTYSSQQLLLYSKHLTTSYTVVLFICAVILTTKLLSMNQPMSFLLCFLQIYDTMCGVSGQKGDAGPAGPVGCLGQKGQSGAPGRMSTHT